MLTQFKTFLLPQKTQFSSLNPNGESSQSNDQITKEISKIANLNNEIMNNAQNTENYIQKVKIRFSTCQNLLVSIQTVQITNLDMDNLFNLLVSISQEISAVPHSKISEITGNIILFCIISVFYNYSHLEDITNESFIYPYVQDNSLRQIQQNTQKIDNYRFMNDVYSKVIYFFYTLLLKESHDRNVYSDYTTANQRFSNLLRNHSFTHLKSILPYCALDRHNGTIYSSLFIDGLSVYFYLTDLNIPHHTEGVNTDDSLEDILIFFQSLFTLYPDLSRYLWEESHPLSKALLLFVDSVMTRSSITIDLQIETLRFLRAVSIVSSKEINEKLSRMESLYSYRSLFGFLSLFYEKIKHLKLKIEAPQPEVIEAILNLLGSLCQNRSICEYILNKNEFHFFDILLSFIYADIPPCVKGSAYTALSVLCSIPQISQTMTDHIILNPVLYNTPQQTPRLMANFPSSNEGIKYEIEFTESGNKRYPISIGFLNLMNALLTTNREQNIVLKAEFSQYFELIQNEILFKINSRDYECQNEKYELFSKCLKFFHNIVSHYTPVIKGEDIRFPFELLTLLFRGGQLFEYVTSLLQTTPKQMNDNKCNSMWNYENADFATQEDSIMETLHLLQTLSKIEDVFTQNIRNYFPEYIISSLSQLITGEPILFNHIFLCLTYTHSNTYHSYGIDLLHYLLSHSLSQDIINKLSINGIIPDLLESCAQYFYQFISLQPDLINDNNSNNSVLVNAEHFLQILISHAEKSGAYFLFLLFGISNNSRLPDPYSVLRTLIELIKSCDRLEQYPTICESITHIFYIVISRPYDTRELLKQFRQSKCFIKTLECLFSNSSIETETISNCNSIISWLLLCIATDLQISTLCNPPVYDNIAFIIDFLFTSENTNYHTSSQTSDNRFLHIFRRIIEDNKPPLSPPNELPEIAQKYNILLERESEGIQYQIIDIRYLNLLLQQSNCDRITIDRSNNWCLDWNIYSTIEFSRILLLQSWNKVLGITLLCKTNIFQIPGCPIRDGSEIELIYQLLERILEPLQNNYLLRIEIKEKIAGIVILLLSQLQERSIKKPYSPQQLSALLQSIINALLFQVGSSLSTSSCYYRGLLYNCLLLYLRWNKFTLNSEILNQKSELLLNALLEDAIYSSDQWRTVALFTLQSVLQYDILGNGLLYLSCQPSFQKLLNKISEYDITCYENTEYGYRSREFLEALLLLFNFLSQTERGALLLVDTLLHSIRTSKLLTNINPYINIQNDFFSDHFYSVLLPICHVIKSILYTLPKHETVIAEVYTLLSDRFAVFQDLLNNGSSTNYLYLQLQSIIVAILIGLLRNNNIDFEPRLKQYSTLYTQLILALSVSYGQQNILYETIQKNEKIIETKKEIFLYCLTYCFYRFKGDELDGIINLYSEYTILSNIIHNCLLHYSNSNDSTKQYLLQISELALYLYCGHLHFWKSDNKNTIELKRDMKKVMQIELIGKNPVFEILLRSIGYYLGM